MILADLCRHHAHLVEQGVGVAPGLERRPIGFSLVLNADGTLQGVEDRRSAEHPLGLPAIVPQAVRRSGTKPAANLLWDFSDFVLGLARTDVAVTEDAVVRHQRFLARLGMLDAAIDPGLAAVHRFLTTPLPQYDFTEVSAAGCTMSFKLLGDDCLVPERPAVRDAVLASGSENDRRQCLVGGDIAAVAAVHPSIRGLPGAHGAGVALVTNNLEAAESHGLGAAPLATERGMAVTSALSHLVYEAPQVRVGPVLFLFWGGNMARRMRDILDAPDAAKGGPLALGGPDSEDVHVLGLEANASRAFVRMYHVLPSLQLIANLGAHFWRLDIPGHRGGRQMTFRHLVSGLWAGAEPPSGIAIGLMEAVLFDRPLPPAFLPLVIKRGLQDGVRAPVAALLRMSLHADFVLDSEAAAIGRLVALAEGLLATENPSLAEAAGTRWLRQAAVAPKQCLQSLRQRRRHLLSRVDSMGLARKGRWFATQMDACMVSPDGFLPNQRRQADMLFAYYLQKYGSST